jgi:lipoprotein signal peptidase
MGRCALALGGTATLLAGVDLVHKALAGSAHFHARSASYVTLVVVLAVAWALAIVLTRSAVMAVGGGVVVGGALGNVASLALWRGIPNPIDAAVVAFNLADVFVLIGFVVVALTAARLAVANGEGLRDPIRLR